MPVKSDVKLGTLGYVILYVKDTEKSLPFYSETLGLKVKTRDPGWVELETGATILALHGEKHEGKEKSTFVRGHGQPTPVFNVENFQKTYEALQQAGLKFESAPQQVCEVGENQVGMCAEFKDPDGNLLSIYGITTVKN
ncbi:MAG TPA: VOC family protein [Chroococcales cyanobacterium]